MAKFKYFKYFRELYMKTLINVHDRIWAEVKYYATVQRLSLNSAVESLLKKALSKLEYDPDIKSEQRI